MVTSLAFYFSLGYIAVINPNIAVNMKPMEMPASRDAASVAREKFGVDLNNDREVLAKMHALQTDANAVAELSNLWGAHQEQKKQAA